MRKPKKSTVIEGATLGMATLLLGVLVVKIGMNLVLIVFVTLVLGFWVIYRYINARIKLLRHESRLKNEKLLEFNRQQFKHFEAFIALNAALKPKYPLPSLRGWAISPDTANIVMQLIGTHQPKVIVECGSGISTVVASYCLSRYQGGHLYALEHVETYAQNTRDMIELHELTKYATVLLAGIVKLQIENAEWNWYDPKVWDHFQDIDLLIVDGPPSHLAKMARYPALPLLEKKLGPKAMILLDDYHREDEKSIVKEWSDKFGFSELMELNTERGACLLRRASHPIHESVHQSKDE